MSKDPSENPIVLTILMRRRRRRRRHHHHHHHHHDSYYCSCTRCCYYYGKDDSPLLPSLPVLLLLHMKQRHFMSLGLPFVLSHEKFFPNLAKRLSELLTETRGAPPPIVLVTEKAMRAAPPCSFLPENLAAVGLKNSSKPSGADCRQRPLRGTHKAKRPMQGKSCNTAKAETSGTDPAN